MSRPADDLGDLSPEARRALNAIKVRGHASPSAPRAETVSLRRAVYLRAAGRRWWPGVPTRCPTCGAWLRVDDGSIVCLSAGHTLPDLGVTE